MKAINATHPGSIGRQATALMTLMVTTLLLSLPQPLAAHEGDTLIPEEPGIAIGAAAVLGWTHAEHSTPASRLTGVTGLGDTPNDSRGWQLEHGTLGLGARLLPRSWPLHLDSQLVVGWHGRDRAHVESAWLQAGLATPWSGFEGERSLLIGLGRTRVPGGAVIDQGGHFDNFGQMPLGKRAAFNGDWIDDGLNIRWQPHLEIAPWLDSIDIGLWRGRRFPGAEEGSPMPVLHLASRFGDLAVDGFIARLEPEGRGAYVQREGSGHVHTAPRCDSSLRDITCFDGRVDLYGASLDWPTPLAGLTLRAAAIHRRERGSLASASGSANYRGRSTGGWLDVIWQFHARWQLGLRQEWLRGRNWLDGIGATRVATDASLLPNQPARRTTAMVSFKPHRDWRLAAEAGRESVAGRDMTIIGLRLIWTPTPWTLPFPDGSPRTETQR